MLSYPEILAPAGNMESLIAALRCGADAVYIGASNFSARQNASNFDLPSLHKAVDLCHLYGAKLYLAVNTILLQSEFSEFASLIKNAADYGIDACIVQDLGAARIIKEIAPALNLHASTQMTIHTPEGALWAKKEGFSRVVISRELNREEIKKICKCKIEVEQFVHGALCMSISGQCMLSAVIGSRSANRGRCAQACRLPFSASCNNENCALSLKDLSLVKHMSNIIEDGVSSLKIEGRMKRPEYVSAAVTALRQAREGQSPDLEVLRAVFSRSGFTDGYYTGIKKDMFGTRIKDDVTSAKTVLPKLAKLYEKPPNRIPLKFNISVHQNKPLYVIVSDYNGNSATITGDFPQIAKNHATDIEQLKRQFEKLGNTPYFCKEISADCDGVSVVSASVLNSLRRKACEEIDNLRVQSNKPDYKIYSTELIIEKNYNNIQTQKRESSLRVRIRTLKQYKAIEEKKDLSILLPLSCAKTLKQAPDNCIIQLAGFTQDEEKLKNDLKKLFDIGFCHLQCENLSHIKIGKEIGYILHGGTRLNIANPISVQEIKRMGINDIILSPELTQKQTFNCSGIIPVGIYAYGHLPVMLMRNCPVKNEIGCKKCNHFITDRTKRNFPIFCENGITTLYNSVPIWLADKIKSLSNIDFFLLDFTTESQTEILSVIHDYKNDSASKQQMTRGLLYRGIK